MKANTIKANKTQGVNLFKKTKSGESILSLAVLIFSMIGVSTVLQLVFLA